MTEGKRNHPGGFLGDWNSLHQAAGNLRP